MKEKRRLNVSNCSFDFCTTWGKVSQTCENVFLSWYQASGARGHGLHLHWDGYCCGLCAGECSRSAGCVCEPGSPQRHLLFHRVAGHGWHRRGCFGHPPGDYHQPGLEHSVLHMPPPFLPAADHHPVLDLVLAGHCHRPISTSQDSHQVRNLIPNFDI